MSTKKLFRAVVWGFCLSALISCVYAQEDGEDEGSEESAISEESTLDDGAEVSSTAESAPVANQPETTSTPDTPVISAQPVASTQENSTDDEFEGEDVGSATQLPTVNSAPVGQDKQAVTPPAPVIPVPTKNPTNPSAVTTSSKDESGDESSESAVTPTSTPVTSTPVEAVSTDSVTPVAPLLSNTPVAATSQLNTVPDKIDTMNVVRSGIDTLGGNEQKLSKEDVDMLDTVNSKSSSGNWVYKNYWWRKIEDVYSQTKEGFNKVMTTRMTFFVKRNDVDKELDRFYQQVGLEQGQLEDIINVGLELMDKEKKEQGFLNKKERGFLDKIKNSKRQLEQLKSDSKAIEELDTKINAAVDVVNQQIDVCSKYEQQVWEIFKNVARELSDKEAQKYYYETKTLLTDVEKVNSYLTGEFSSYFDKMLGSVKEHTQSIITQLSALEKEGVSLRKELEIFEKEDDAQEKEDLEKKKLEQEKVDKKKKAEQKGFFSSMTFTVSSWFSFLFGLVGSATNFVKGLFVGKEVSSKPVDAVKLQSEEEGKNLSQNNTAATLAIDNQ